MNKECTSLLNEKVIKLLNNQINAEFYSSYLYLDMSFYYAEEGLDGFSNWFMIQAMEEKDHALLFCKYLQNNEEKVILEEIKKPDIIFSDFKDPLVNALRHEQYVTDLIHNMYDAAYSLKDFRTMQFLDWFIKEQGEEELNGDTLIKKYDLFGSDAKGLYMLDNELGARVYSAPSLIL